MTKMELYNALTAIQGGADFYKESLQYDNNVIRQTLPELADSIAFWKDPIRTDAATPLIVAFYTSVYNAFQLLANKEDV